MVRNIGEKNSILSQFVSEIRDINIQQDSMRFRRNLERIGEIFAYEISKELEYKNTDVETPLGICNMDLPVQNIVLSTILRAGLPFHQGFLNYFDKAENAFVSAYRKYHKDGTFEINMNYLSSPSLEGKILILTDTMLATGASFKVVYQALVENEEPVHTHIAIAIASQEGLKAIEKFIPNDKITIWVAAIDSELTAKSYIVPGLGDAGDLAYGEKEY